jgi:predicted acyltransferase
MNMYDNKSKLKKRLMSLDALRGLDMFFLVGLGGIFRALPKLSENEPFLWLANQCRHPDWEGFTAWDTVFPMFIFIVGVAMPFSFAKRLEKEGGKRALFRHVLVRTLVLAILGVVRMQVPGGAHPHWGFYSVLYLIGFSYFFAAIIMMNTSIRGQVYWTFGILIGYWLMMRFVSISGYGAGDFSREGNLNAYTINLIAENISPDFKYVFNLAKFPNISNALFGVLAGHWLMSARKPPDKALGLLIGGTALIVAALLVHLDFPINKKLSSPSFILLTSGISAVFLSVFFWLIDVRKYRKWAFFLVVVGVNPITIYMASALVSFGSIARVFAGGFDFWNAQPLVFAAIVAAIEWLFLYYLYKQRVFLKI